MRIHVGVLSVVAWMLSLALPGRSDAVTAVPDYHLNAAVGVSSFTDYTASELNPDVHSAGPLGFTSYSYSQTFGPYEGNVFVTDSTTLGGYADAGRLGATLDVTTYGRITEYITMSYTDYVTFTSDTLPVGTVVQIESIYTLDATLTGSAIAALAHSNAGYLFESGTVESTVPWTAHVGDTVALSDFLTLETTILSDVATISATLQIDASNTSHTYLKILTPGVSYTTASGASYDAPVPEPSAALLLLAGAPALTWCVRRRRQAKAACTR